MVVEEEVEEQVEAELEEKVEGGEKVRMQGRGQE